MENKKLLSISLIILSVSILLGSGWIGYSIQKSSPTSIKTEKLLLTEEEAASYLNMSITEFNTILAKDEITKKELTSYDTYRFIPYLILYNKNKMFSKEELNQWVKYNTLNNWN